MKKIAVYGKGGIGKSTIVSNLSLALSEMGYKVMQIGCDPKADSTMSLRQGRTLRTVLDVVRERRDAFTLEDISCVGKGGVVCVEAGGPIPGLGCAGRGIITALEKLEAKGAYSYYKPDLVIYDVLGDVVCGGFSMPMRGGYADQVLIITSGENMAIYAAANIAMALGHFKGRGYAALGGLILNRRNVRHEYEKVTELSEEIGAPILADIPRSEEITDAEEAGKLLLEAFPECAAAMAVKALAGQLADWIGAPC